MKKWMLTLYIIRHGETEWNKAKRMQGRLDSDLTEKGRRDAKLLGERIKDIEFKRMISSPSKRTLHTAQLVRGTRQIPVETDERLMEIDLGDWQGRVESEIRDLYQAAFDAYWNRPESYESAGGESFYDVANRVASFLEDLEKTSSEGSVLIITHAVAVKALYMLCRNAAVERIWDPPFIHGTSLTILQIDQDKKEFLLEGCMAHCE